MSDPVESPVVAAPLVVSPLLVCPLLLWEAGKGQVAIHRLVGDTMDVFASAPSAPGSRPAITLPGGEVVRMKVHRCRAATAGTPPPPPAPHPGLGFFLEGRLIDQTRTARAEIERLLGQRQPDEAAPP